MKRLLIFITLLCSFVSINIEPPEEQPSKEFQKIQAGIVRGDVNEKSIALVFTSDGYSDGYEVIRATLKKHRTKGSFFFTGNAFRRPEFEPIIKNLLADGHYISAHSDRHLLYCAWENRDSLLVTRDEFVKDMNANYDEMAKFGISKTDAPYYIPPYEHYNDTISKWSAELGLVLINYTAGTDSNADYTTPDMSTRYRDSETIYNSILQYESKNDYGLNGFLLLIHFGVHPDRTDKLYNRMDDLVNELKRRGYRFVNVRELLEDLIPNIQ